MLLIPADLDHTADVQLHACKGLFLLLFFQSVLALKPILC